MATYSRASCTTASTCSRCSPFELGRERDDVVDLVAERASAGAIDLAEVVEHGAYLGPFEEAARAAHAERDPFRVERGLELGRLRVRAVQHGHRPPRDALVVRGAQSPGDAPRLAPFVVVAAHRGPRPVGARGARRGPLLRGRTVEHHVGGDDDRACRPVVRGQAEQRRTREQPVETVERVRLGTGEAVDGLRVVAHGREIASGAEPAAQHAQLRGRDVLELVDVEMPEAEALACGEVGIVLEGVGAPPEHVVEVDELLGALGLLVARVDVGDLARRAGEWTLRPLGGFGVRLGAERACLGPFDLGGELTDRDGGRRALAQREQRHEQLRLAVDQARERLPTVAGAPAELRQRDRVERARRDLTAAERTGEPRPELAGSLARVRDREHARCRRATGGAAPRDPPRERAGLARPGRSRHREQLRLVDDRDALALVEAEQQRVGIARARRRRRPASVSDLRGVRSRRRARRTKWLRWSRDERTEGLRHTR